MMDPNALAFMSMLFGTSGGKTQSLNKTQDLMSWLFDPNFAILTGSYDPYLTLGQQAYVPDQSVAMPTLMSESRGTGTLARIANGLLGGAMTYSGALGELTKAQATEGSDVFGLDLKDQVSKMWDELSKYQQDVDKAAFDQSNAAAETPYAKAGLPTPDKRWAVEDMPSSDMMDAMKAAIAKHTADVEARGQKFAGPAPTKTVYSAGRQGSPSVKGSGSKTPDSTSNNNDLSGWNSRAGSFIRDNLVEPVDPAVQGLKGVLASPFYWGDKGIQAAYNWLFSNPSDGAAPKGKGGQTPTKMQIVDPQWLKDKAAWQAEQKALAAQQKSYDVVADARRRTLEAMGRTPFMDALNSRLQAAAMARSLGLA